MKQRHLTRKQRKLDRLIIAYQRVKASPALAFSDEDARSYLYIHQREYEQAQRLTRAYSVLTKETHGPVDAGITGAGASATTPATDS